MRVISAVYFALAASVSAECYGNYNEASLAATKKGKPVKVKKGSVALKMNKDYVLSITGADCEKVATKVGLQYSSKGVVACTFTAEDGVATTVAFSSSEKKQSSSSAMFLGGFKSFKVKCDGTVKLFNAVVMDPLVTEPCAVSEDLGTGLMLAVAGEKVDYEFPKCGQSGTYDVSFGIQAKQSGSFTLSTGSSQASKTVKFVKKGTSVSSAIVLSSVNKTAVTLTLVGGKLRFLRVVTGTARDSMPTSVTSKQAPHHRRVRSSKIHALVTQQIEHALLERALQDTAGSSPDGLRTEQRTERRVVRTERTEAPKKASSAIDPLMLLLLLDDDDSASGDDDNLLKILLLSGGLGGDSDSGSSLTDNPLLLITLLDDDDSGDDDNLLKIMLLSGGLGGSSSSGSSLTDNPLLLLTLLDDDSGSDDDDALLYLALSGGAGF